MNRSASASIILISTFAATASAAVDYSAIRAGLVHGEEIQALAGAAGTNAIDGLVVLPGGNLAVVHSDATNVETLLQIDPAVDPPTGSTIRTAAQLQADLGFGGSLILDSGFAVSADGSRLYIGTTDSADLDGEITIASLLTAGGPASSTVTGPQLDDMTDFAVLPTGEIVAVRGADGVGIINPADVTPAWAQRITQAQIQAVLGTVDPAPAETVAVNPTNGDVYVFCHDVKELLRIEDILSVSPTVTRVNVPGWPGVVDFHDLAVDSEGVLYGFDEAGESLRIWDGISAFEFAIDDLVDSLPVAKKQGSKHEISGPVSVTLWRGLGVRFLPPDSAVAYLALAGEDGILTVTFGGEATASTADWALYH